MPRKKGLERKRTAKNCIAENRPKMQKGDSTQCLIGCRNNQSLIRSDEGAELLVQAIVEHAVIDYQNAKKHIAEYEKALLENATDEELQVKLSVAKDTKEECERFFCSQYCYSFTGMDGDQLIEMINKKGKRAKKKNE